MASNYSRRFLIGLPFLPGPRANGGTTPLRRLLDAAAQEGGVDLCVAGHSPDEAARLANGSGPVRMRLVETDAEDYWARLRRRVSQEKYDAILLVDFPAVRGLMNRLILASNAPTALVMIPGIGDFGGVSAPRPACSPREAWCLGGEADSRRTQGLLPYGVHRAPGAESGWLRSRLRALAERRGARASRGMASIIVPCFNNLRYTRECLEAIRRNTEPPYEVIAVDNASTDGTAAWLAGLRDPRARLIRNSANQGFARAINQGMGAARGDYLVWLNNDVAVASGWLDRLIACAERAPWIGAVGPTTNECEGPQRLARLRLRTTRDRERLARALHLGFGGRAVPVHRLVGFCLLVKREALRRVGFLDERFGAGCYEDFDYCLRLRQAGFELAIAEDSFVFHYGHKSFPSEAARLRLSAANREVFIEKWCRRSLEFLDEIDPLLPRSARGGHARGR